LLKINLIREKDKTKDIRLLVIVKKNNEKDNKIHNGMKRREGGLYGSLKIPSSASLFKLFVSCYQLTMFLTTPDTYIPCLHIFFVIVL
jgi:hypothetical protein